MGPSHDIIDAWDSDKTRVPAPEVYINHVRCKPTSDRWWLPIGPHGAGGNGGDE